MNLTAYQLDILNAKICPYCKSETQITTETAIYGKEYKNRSVICCKNFPHCDSYVGTHDDGSPLGRLANKALRYRKGHAHLWFDKIWKEKLVERSALYSELSDFLNLPGEYTHIGMFSEKTCLEAEKWAKNYYQQLTNSNGKK